ncbi:MAG TPA: MFS transporter [Bacteroidales bacterium]|nr:MFS transporter [Bacteroidales bacterium]
MENVTYPKYRFVVLAAYSFITATVEIQWLTHASVARPAEVFYAGQFSKASFFNIDFIAMVYMLAFLVISFPASYIIDKYGIKKGVGAGAVLLGAFSLLKAISANNFTGVLIAQAGLAIAQPFIINAVTAVSVRWFPLNERAMAAGLAVLAQFIGIIIAMLITPLIVGSDPSATEYGSGFGKMLWIYCMVSLLSVVAFFVFVKEKPSNADIEAENRQTFLGGLRMVLSHRDMIITLFLFLIGLGIFNAVSSMTDSIAEKLGVKDSDGYLGGVMLIGGIVGAVIIPVLSDYYKKRKLFLVICLAGMIPGIAGLSYASELAANPAHIYAIALIGSFVLGFFVMSAGPIGFQYAAEVTSPAPESVSQGILLWVGQLTGMIFVFAMSYRSNHFLGLTMNVFFALSILTFIMVLFVKESPLMPGKK